MQRGGGVYSSADLRVVDTKHLYALEESGQQSSEEEAFTLLPIKGSWSTTRCIIMRRRIADSSAARRRGSFYCRSEAGRGGGASSCAGGERAAAQRGRGVHSSVDQRLGDAVHHHAQEESEQQRSEEETLTLLPIRD